METKNTPIARTMPGNSREWSGTVIEFSDHLGKWCEFNGPHAVVEMLNAQGASIRKASDENAALRKRVEELEAKSSAYDDLQWLIGEGMHRFEFDADADNVSLICYDEVVSTGVAGSHDITATLIAQMRRRIAASKKEKG